MLTFFLQLFWLQIWPGDLQPTQGRSQIRWTCPPRLLHHLPYKQCAPIATSQVTLWKDVFCFTLSLGNQGKSPDFPAFRQSRDLSTCNVDCWGCYALPQVHTITGLRELVLMSFGHPLTHLASLGLEEGNEVGCAPEFAGVVPLISCKSVSSSLSHSCEQCKTSPLAKEFTTPSGSCEASVALADCL